MRKRIKRETIPRAQIDRELRTVVRAVSITTSTRAHSSLETLADASWIGRAARLYFFTVKLTSSLASSSVL